MNDEQHLSVEARLERLERRLRDFETWARDAQGYRPVGGPPVTSQASRLPSPLISSDPTGSTRTPAAAPSPAAPTAPALPAPAQPRVPAWTFADVEQLLGGRGLAWAGGLAILLGVVFFLGVAFTRGWIGPAARVSIGLIAGAAFAAGGAWFFERREKLFGHVLVATGFGTLGIALIAATRLYHLLPTSAGLAGSLLIALAAAMIAIRADTQIVAGYGLVAALAAPPLLGASADLTTITFLATALVGTTSIALFRSWRWLPGAAFLLVAPQIAAWLFDVGSLPLGLLVLLGFWTLNIIAAGGEEYRASRQLLRASSAALLIANAAFLVAGGLFLLSEQRQAELHGLFVLGVALLHALVAAYFLARDGQQHPFGLLAAGTAVAAVTMAVPIQLGGSVVPIAWAAEAVALAAVYALRNHVWSGRAALLLAALAGLHVVSVEYPIDAVDRLARSAIPFVSGRGGVLVFLLLALGAASALLRSPRLRAGLAIAGALLLGYALPFEVADAVVVVGWSLLALALVLAGRGRTEAELYRGAAALLGSLALLLTLGVVAPLDRLVVHGWRAIARPPFWSNAALALASLIVAAAGAGILDRGGRYRRWLLALAGALFVYLLSVGVVDEFQRQVMPGGDVYTLQKQAQVALSILWSALGGLALAAGVLRWQRAVRAFGLGLLALATAKVFLYDLQSLDATYKVASFIGLGLLLLASSYVYQHLGAKKRGQGASS